jgi:hypothetical protein
MLQSHPKVFSFFLLLLLPLCFDLFPCGNSVLGPSPLVPTFPGEDLRLLDPAMEHLEDHLVAYVLID